MDPVSTFDNLYDIELPEDMIIDILRRLPVKDVVKFLSVCTSWYRMISNVCIPIVSPPYPTAQFLGFIMQSQLFRSRSQRTILFEKEEFCLEFCSDNTETERFDLDSHVCFMKSSSIWLPYEPEALLFQDWCNGLVLFARRLLSKGKRIWQWDFIGVEYLVFNPTTRECVSLPVNPTHNYFGSCFGFLAIDPACSTNFRVVLFKRSIYEASASSPPVIDVFYSETAKWSSHSIPVDDEFCGTKHSKKFIYLNGTFYSLCSSVGFIICINSGVSSPLTESWCPNAFALPIPKRKIRSEGYIGTSRGCLYYSNYATRDIFGLWVLDKGHQWVLQHTIDMEQLRGLQSVIELSEEFRNILGYHRIVTIAIHPLNPEELFMGNSKFILRCHLPTKEVTVFYKRSDYDPELQRDEVMYPHWLCPRILNSTRP